MKIRTITLILVVAMVAGIVSGAETATTGVGKNVVDKGMPAAPEVKLPSKDTVEYWVIRSQTLTEFVPYMTQKRTEFKETRKLMSEFLVSIGKGEDFLKSNVKAPDNPKLYHEVIGMGDRIAQADVNLPEKRLDWEPGVEFAMRIIMIEGYLPTHVADDEEFETIKQLCAQKEKYGQKVREELHGFVQECLDVWFYLDTIDKQAAYREYAFLVEEKERKEKEAGRAERDAQRRDRRMQEGEARKAWEFDKREQRRADMQARRYDVRPRGYNVRYRSNRFNYTYRRYRW